MRAMGVDLIHDHADFRLMSGKAVKALSTFGEVNLFLRGIMPLVGFRSAMVYYDRTERLAGTSKYLLWKMVAFAAEGVTSFSIVPLRFITATGLVVFLVTGAISCWVLWIRLFTTTAVPGWPSTVLPLYFLGGIQIFSLGVIGEYLGKVYQEVKKRPRYIIETII
jgi:glycosyltransferase involved in cell wall biosynthesis